jgi:predicted flap endonuclease-1-like 5' DNA nuclease
MGLLQKLKSALGLNGAESSGSGRSGDVDVTVEREPSTEHEDAVKGTETASNAEQDEETTDDESSVETANESEADDTPSADGFETAAEAGLVEEAEDEPDDDETTVLTEDAEAEGAEDSETTVLTENAEIEETGDDSGTDGEPDDTDDAVEGSSDPVTELNGIGPAYGDRLAGVGIETVGELAVADAAEVADQIDLGESRVSDWVEQANAY